MDPQQDPDWFRPAPWRTRLAGWTAAVLVLGFAAAVFGSPYFALGSFKLAAKRGDEVRIEKLADLPALRASLKAQLTAALAGRKNAEFETAILLSDSFIDAVLTPGNLVALVNGADFMRQADSPPPAPPSAASPAGEASAVETTPPDSDPVVVNAGYASLNRFEVSVGRLGRGPPLIFSFRRKGLFGWVLSDIRLSPAALRRIARG